MLSYNTSSEYRKNVFQQKTHHVPLIILIMSLLTDKANYNKALIFKQFCALVILKEQNF